VSTSKIIAATSRLRIKHTDFNDSDGIECYAFAHAVATASCFDDLDYSISVATECYLMKFFCTKKECVHTCDL
jgi:hypothetical protein